MLEERRIYSTSARASEIKELLQLVFASELLDPGDQIWLVSPWISDVVILDNRSGQFFAINPEWPKSEIRLIRVILHLMSMGTEFRVVTRPDKHNNYFLDKLKNEIESHALSRELLLVSVREELHLKGILTPKGILLGSMNITTSGLEILEEYVEYSSSPEKIAEARTNFENRYLEH